MRYQSKYVPIAGIYEVFDVVEQRAIEQSELISRLNEADRQRAGVSRDEFAALQQTVAAQQVQIDGMQKILIGQPQQPATPRREPIDVQALFEQYYGDEHGRFDRVVNPPHPRPDIAALILLDRLVPDPGRKMISSAGHKQVMWLNISPEKLAAATEDDILTLVRCGVVFDRKSGGLVMYV